MNQVQVDREGNEYELLSISCPTCGPSRERLVGLRGGAQHRYGLGIESQIVQCMQCDLYYPNPFPVPANSQRLYADPAKYFESHDSEAKISAFKQVLEKVAELRGSRPASLLDVGSGQGEMLAAARSLGVSRIVGLELSDAMIETSQERYGVQVLAQLIEEHEATSPEPYDVVILNAVLEHVRDPDSMISACRKVLANDGILYIDIPNEDHLLATILGWANRFRGRRGVFILSPTFPPYHVFGFNRRSLNTLLSKHGFLVEQFEMTGRLQVPARGGFRDRIVSNIAAGLSLISGPLGMGHNMFVWARLGPAGNRV